MNRIEPGRPLTAAVRVLIASLNLFLITGLSMAAEVTETVAPPSPPPQASRAPEVAPAKKKKAAGAPVAKKWRSKRKERAAAKAAKDATPAQAPVPFGPEAPPHLRGSAIGASARINPIVATAAVSLPPAVVAGLAAGGVSAPALEADDLAVTAERIRRSWLLASAMGPPAMGVAVATLSAITIGQHDGTARAVIPAASDPVWDAHLPGQAAPGVAADPVYRRLRVFGHLGVNHWEGERNVGQRAGPNGGTTNIWDAAIGVDSRLAEDMELRVRALTILPAVSNDGDGAAAGSPGGAVNFKDFIYMRDIYLGILHLFGWKQLNMRLGRVPIAFGDEYKQYDAPDNPLVSHSVPFFWGFDEGAQLYGNLSPDISYTLHAFLDGEIGNGSDEFASKAWGLRVEGNHGKAHWSASYFDSGRTGRATQLPSLYFGRELAAPIGANGARGGASTSATILSEWWEGDFCYTFDKGYIALARGYGNLHDDNVHDRTFEWFKVEPLYKVARRWDLVGRYSGMNVEDAAQGYRFNSFETVGTELNFDVNERQRLSIGARYWANEAVQFKLERTIEQWKLIPTALAASIIAETEHRDYTVLQAAVSF